MDTLIHHDSSYDGTGNRSLWEQERESLLEEVNLEMRLEE